MPSSPHAAHTTQGQAWDQVAKSSYGSEKLMNRLVSGNMDEADALFFSGNTVLGVPEVSAADARRASIQPAPWERL